MKKYFYVFLVISVALNCFFAWNFFYKSSNTINDSPLATPDQIEVIRTEGGLLQVSSLKTTETFSSATDHQILGLVSFGKTISQISVPAVFHYHIPLALEWRIKVRGNNFIVIAPSVMPTLPVAIDTEKLKYFSAGTWSFFTGKNHSDALQKTITKTLEAKAYSPSYVQYQRETARKTVNEFVQKWIASQDKWKAGGPYTISVVFADEPISSYAAIP